MKQRGVSFLEIIVVVAILLVARAFVSPSIMDWRAKRSLEADYLTLVSTIDFVKTRVRTINGTGLLICNPNSVMTYQISSNPQSTASTVSGSFASNLLEDPTSKDPTFNILSGGSTITSSLCTSGRGIFASTGLTGVEGSGNVILIELNRGGVRDSMGAYLVKVNQSTGFVQKYKWKQANSTWLELD